MTGSRFDDWAEIRRFTPAVVSRALELQTVRWPGLFDRFSADQMANTVEDTNLHLEYLAGAVWAGEQALFDDYIAWGKALFYHRDMPFEWLTGSVADVREAVVELAPAGFSECASDVVDTALAGFEALPTELESFVHVDRPLGSIGREYLNAALKGDRQEALRIVVDAAEGGVPIADIYAYFFLMTQRELGRMWQSNVITVAQEHIATEVTRAAMGRLYPYVCTLGRGEHTLVATAMRGERHGIGAQMVADFFEMAGWSSYLVGVDTPTGALIETIADVDADVLAMSVTMTSRIPEVASVISTIRSDPRTDGLRILVGGYPFNLVPELWRTVGADGYAATARQGVETAENLVTA